MSNWGLAMRGNVRSTQNPKQKNGARSRKQVVTAGVYHLREDIEIPTYKPQKVLCEVTYFSPNQHM